MSTPFDSKPTARFLTLDQLSHMPRPAWLIEGLFEQHSLVMLAAPSYSFKAQPLTEPILTPTGWRYMGDLQAGDQVIGSSGLPIDVVGVHPQGEVDEWKVTLSDGTSTTCAPDHLWTVHRGHGGREITLKTTQLIEKLYGKQVPFIVPNLSPVSFLSIKLPLPLDPYLLGCLLGDGGLTHYVGFTSADPFIIDTMKKVIPTGCQLKRIPSSMYGWKILPSSRGGINVVQDTLTKLGLMGKKSESKFVPQEYLFAAPAERLKLLQGLMDTDGTIGEGTTNIFCTSSPQLAENMIFLARSLGALVNPLFSLKTTHLLAYRVSFRMPRGINAFSLPRKRDKVIGRPFDELYRRVVSVVPTGRKVLMQCITVGASNGLYVTRDFILTHNSFMAIDWMMCLAAGKPWIGRPTATSKVLYVLGEGKASLLKRIEAWKEHFKPTVSEWTRLNENFRTSFEVPQLAMKSSVDNMLAQLRQEEFSPTVIVIDTFARSFVGLDENSQKDTGLWVEQADRLRQLGYTVVFLHHTSKNTEFGLKYRGSTAIMGAMDTAMTMQRDMRANTVELSVTKQKDHDEGDPMLFNRLIVGGKDGSVVLTPTVKMDQRFVVDERLARELTASLLEDASYPSDWARARELAAQTGLTDSAAQSRLARLKRAADDQRLATAELKSPREADLFAATPPTEVKLFSFSGLL